MTKLKKFSARNVAVLNLTRRPDLQGDIFPPECNVIFENPVPVVYEFDYRKVIGKAYLMRVKNQIIADFQLVSGIDDPEEAKSLIQNMYPAISARVNEKVREHVLGIHITAISVGYSKNADQYITPLGERVVRVRKRIS